MMALNQDPAVISIFNVLRLMEIKDFFTGFRDGFPLIYVRLMFYVEGRNGIYSGVDFGIMGSLSDADRDHLARNFAAFFARDYKEVAIAFGCGLELP
jgi:hypothetical protein